jgi:hypothetical protein
LNSIHSKYEVAYPALEKFLCSVGRRKFVRPLFAALIETSAGKEMAKEIYKKARPSYHTVTTQTIDEMLK